MHVSLGNLVFWKPRERVCADCASFFVATAPRAFRCPACAVLRAAQVQSRAHRALQCEAQGGAKVMDRRESIVAAIARCDRELEEIDQRPDRDTAPAYLVALGRFDWEHEKRILEWLAGIE